MLRPLSRRLSGEDAAFLYFDKPAMPMHVGSLGIYEGTIPFDALVRHLERRLMLVPRYRQRVAFVPFNLAHPVWEDDPEFDLRRHLRRLRLRGRVDERRLREVASELFAPPLARDRPLWDATLIEGLPDGRCALLARAHHCMVDGIAGVELLEAALDFGPVPRKVRVPANARYSANGSRPAARLADAFWERLRQQVDFWTDLESAAVSPRAPLRQTATIVRSFQKAAPFFLVPAHPSPLNEPVAPARRLAWTDMPFSDVRAIRKSLDVTINDVVLAILAGALARYVHREPSARSLTDLRVLIPVNVRHQDQAGALGNRVSFMLAELPLATRDPLGTLAAVRERIGALKQVRQAEGVDLLARLLGRLPPPLLSTAVSAVPFAPNTLANVLCTNVPGPMVPLYCTGHRMLAHYVLAPVAWDMGMSVGVMSYDQRLFWCLATSATAVPHPERMAADLQSSFRELMKAAGVAPSETPEAAEIGRRGSPMKPAAGARRNGARSLEAVVAAGTERR